MHLMPYDEEEECEQSDKELKKISRAEIIATWRKKELTKREAGFVMLVSVGSLACSKRASHNSLKTCAKQASRPTVTSFSARDLPTNHQPTTNRRTSHQLPITSRCT